ncbi:hypothetical protein ID866_8579 [Astraeus odoratus]|nr:hypothetical protein ID866_8579 [Astraeus odoratus]
MEQRPESDCEEFKNWHMRVCQAVNILMMNMPDSVFGCIMHLETADKMFSYLARKFGDDEPIFVPEKPLGGNASDRKGTDDKAAGNTEVATDHASENGSAVDVHAMADQRVDAEGTQAVQTATETLERPEILQDEPLAPQEKLNDMSKEPPSEVEPREDSRDEARSGKGEPEVAAEVAQQVASRGSEVEVEATRVVVKLEVGSRTKPPNENALQEQQHPNKMVNGASYGSRIPSTTEESKRKPLVTKHVPQREDALLEGEQARYTSHNWEDARPGVRIMDRPPGSLRRRARDPRGYAKDPGGQGQRVKTSGHTQRPCALNRVPDDPGGHRNAQGDPRKARRTPQSHGGHAQRVHSSSGDNCRWRGSVLGTRAPVQKA